MNGYVYSLLNQKQELDEKNMLLAPYNKFNLTGIIPSTVGMTISFTASCSASATAKTHFWDNAKAEAKLIIHDVDKAFQEVWVNVID